MNENRPSAGYWMASTFIGVLLAVVFQLTLGEAILEQKINKAVERTLTAESQPSQQQMLFETAVAEDIEMISTPTLTAMPIVTLTPKPTDTAKETEAQDDGSLGIMIVIIAVIILIVVAFNVWVWL